MKLVWRSYFIGIIMEKGLLVDIGRKYWSIAELKRLVLLLQEHKLTHLQLHLNENEGFALNFTDSPVSKKYSENMLKELKEFAKTHEITLIPDFDSPGHMGSLLEQNPEFALPDSNQQAVDVTNPAVIDWIIGIIDKIVDIFPDSDTFHIGADEFIDFRQIEKYPYLVEKTREKYGNKASGLEFYYDYVNQLTEHMQKKGKQVRIWNDGFLRKDLQSLVPLNKNVEVCYWTNWDKGMAEVKEWLAKGYTLINFCDNDLYYVLGEEAGYSYPTAEKLEREGKIQKFSGQQYLNQEEMKAVRGTYFSIWADNAAAKSVSEILDDLSKVLPVFMKIYGGNDE